MILRNNQKQRKLITEIRNLIKEKCSRKQISDKTGLSRRKLDYLIYKNNLPKPVTVRKTKEVLNLFHNIKKDLRFLNAKEIRRKYRKHIYNRIYGLFQEHFKTIIKNKRNKKYNQVIKLFLRGFKNKEICDRLNLKHESVSYVLQKQNLITRKRLDGLKKNKRDINLMNDYNKGMSIMQISKKYSLINPHMTLHLINKANEKNKN